jgi:hypothetical protein
MPNMRKVSLRAQLHFSPVKPYKTYQGFTAQKNYLDTREIRYPKKRITQKLSGSIPTPESNG